MSVLMVVGIVMVVWIGFCVLVVALCASAKEGDGEHASLAPEAVLRPRRHRTRRRAPALS